MRCVNSIKEVVRSFRVPEMRYGNRRHHVGFSSSKRTPQTRGLPARFRCCPHAMPHVEAVAVFRNVAEQSSSVRAGGLEFSSASPSLKKLTFTFCSSTSSSEGRMNVQGFFEGLFVFYVSSTANTDVVYAKALSNLPCKSPPSKLKTTT